MGGGGNDQSDITNSVKDSCLKSMVQSSIDSDIKFNIKQSLNSIFNNNDDINLTFVEDISLQDSIDGTATLNAGGNGYQINAPHSSRLLSVLISLNGNKLPYASQEYITATILHEVLHAYFIYSQTIIDHNNMADNYIMWFKNSMLNIYPNMTINDAEALAWGGLGSTWRWNNTLTNISRNNIININQNYKNGNSGSKCK
jgi:hypothetical protein